MTEDEYARPPPSEADALRRLSRQTAHDLDALASAAWMRMARHHPDQSGWTAARRMEEINDELKQLGDLSFETLVRLRIRMDTLGRESC